MSSRRRARRWAPVILLVAFLGLAASAAADPGHGTIPEANSPVQEQIAELYEMVSLLAIATAVLVLGLMGYFIVRYRDGSGTRKSGEWFTHDTRLEVTWTVGTALVLVILSGITIQAMGEIEEAPSLRDGSDHTDVIAIGTQWQWSFAYPDGTTSEGVLHVEANRTYRIYSASCDVLHAVYIPNLAVKIDTTVLDAEACDKVRRGELPEDQRVNRFWMQPDEGTYGMKCAEYCGTAHAFMDAEVVAFEPGSREKHYGPPPDRGEVHHVEIADDGEVRLSPDRIRLNTGDLTTWFVHNNASSEHTLSVAGALEATTGPIQPGETGEVRFTADQEGTFDVTVDDDPRGLLEVTAGEVVHVELNDNPWYVRDGGQFEPGKTYAIKAWNNGSIDHNLYIGTYTQNREDREPLFKTETYPAGEFRWLNVTMPDEDVTLDWWCDVPGHAGAGMLDEITVGQGGERGEQMERDLIPAPGVAGALAGILAAAAAASWRRR